MITKKDIELELVSRLILYPQQSISVSQIIKPEDFDHYGKVYEIILNSFVEEKEVNHEIRKGGFKLSEFDLTSSYRFPNEIAKDLKEYANARNVKRVITEFSKKIPDNNLESFIAQLQVELTNNIESSTRETSAIKDLIEDFQKEREEYLKKPAGSIIGISTGYEKLDNIIDGLRPEHLWVIGGYCLGKGTKVIMADGAKKNVEDIMTGEYLAGVNSNTNRLVLGTTKGVDKLYRISGKYIDSYVVNSGHLLPVLDWGGRKKLLTAEKLAKLKNTKNYRMFKHPFIGEQKELSINPYYLGYWLGDGTTGVPSITCDENDTETISFVKNYAKILGLRFVKTRDTRNQNVLTLRISTNKGGDIKKRQNKILINLPKTKEIPKEYMLSSMEQRLELLAGLIDSDGYVGGANRDNFVFCQKDILLTRQVRELAESLGFNTNIKKTFQKSSPLVKNVDGNVLYKLTITGNTGIIPTKIKRKKIKKEKANENTITFKIEQIDSGEYYGFELDGNHLFMVENNIVNHNTNMGKTFATLNIVANLIAQKKRVVIYSLEMSKNDVISRLLGIMTEQNGLAIMKGTQKNPIEKAVQSLVDSHLSIITNKSEVSDITFSMFEENIKSPVDLFVVDFIQLVTLKNSKSEYETTTESILKMQQTAKKLKKPIMVVSQISNDGAKNQSDVVMSFKGSGAIAAAADLAIEIVHDEEDARVFKEKIQAGEKVSMKWRVMKNRHGRVGYQEMEFMGQTGIFTEPLKNF